MGGEQGKRVPLPSLFQGRNKTLRAKGDPDRASEADLWGGPCRVAPAWTRLSPSRAPVLRGP